MIDKTKKICIVGVSSNPEKYGFIVYKDLKDSGYDVVAVNPNLEYVDSDRCYHSIKEIPYKIDVLVCVVQPNVCYNIIKEAYHLGIKNVWIQPGAESEESIEFCKKHNINVIHNSCIMIEK